MSNRRTFFYAAVGERLTAHQMDVDGAQLHRGESVSLPAWVQYAWPHPERRILYVVSSNGGPSGGEGDTHHASVFDIDAETGALTQRGAQVELTARPIHCSVDGSGEFLLIAYNRPSGLSVHRLADDGALADEVPQQAGLDVGIYAHQVRVSPSNRTVVLVSRGNDARPNTTTGVNSESPELQARAEEPGALKLFHFSQGRLGAAGSVTPPGDGYGFGPRHLDVHPNGRWVYVSVERQDELQTYEFDAAGTRLSGPLYTVDALADRAHPKGPQLACAVRVHPSGHYVYQANRTDGVVLDDGWWVMRGGEDSLVVYAIDPDSGEPTIIQRVPTDTIHVRTFSIDPSGRLLIAASIQPVPVRTPDGDVRLVPAALALYRIGSDGRLSQVRTYEVNTKGLLMFWTGMVTIDVGQAGKVGDKRES